MQLEDHTRRQLLWSLVGALSVGAGCNEGQSPTGTETAGSPEPSLPGVTRTEVAESNLVVHLAESNDVATLSLIGPDGTAVTERDVATGATTVKLPILELDPDLGSYEHYTPGDHELVVDTGETTARTTVPLEPDLRITNVEQYTDGDAPADLGNLAVEIENTGTGPTWVHDITFSDAPNFAANGEISDDPGVLLISKPSQEEEVILKPGDSQRYIGSSPPLTYSEDSNIGCESLTSQFILLIGIATGSTIEHQIHVESSGEKRSLGSTDRFTCGSFNVSQGSR